MLQPIHLYNLEPIISGSKNVPCSALLRFRTYMKALLKHKVNFKIHDAAAWLTNSYNTHIAQYLTK